MRTKKEVFAMKDILLEIIKQVKYPTIPHEGSDIQLNNNLINLGFNEKQINNILIPIFTLQENIKLSKKYSICGSEKN